MAGSCLEETKTFRFSNNSNGQNTTRIYVDEDVLESLDLVKRYKPQEFFNDDNGVAPIGGFDANSDIVRCYCLLRFFTEEARDDEEKNRKRKEYLKEFKKLIKENYDGPIDLYQNKRISWCFLKREKCDWVLCFRIIN